MNIKDENGMIPSSNNVSKNGIRNFYNNIGLVYMNHIGSIYLNENRLVESYDYSNKALFLF